MGAEQPSASEAIIINNIVSGLDALQYAPCEVVGRTSYGFEEYRPIDLSPEVIAANVDALQLLIQIATNSFRGQLARSDMPIITQFHVDKIPGGDRMFLNATTATHAFNTSIIRGDSEMFVSIMRSKIGLRGVNERGKPTHDPGDYLDCQIRAQIV